VALLPESRLIANTVSFSQGMSKASQIAMTTGKNIQRSLTLITVEATAMATAVIGSLTAAIVKAAVHRAMRQYAPSMAKGTSQAMSDRNSRVPSNHRQ